MRKVLSTLLLAFMVVCFVNTNIAIAELGDINKPVLEITPSIQIPLGNGKIEQLFFVNGWQFIQTRQEFDIQDIAIEIEPVDKELTKNELWQLRGALYFSGVEDSFLSGKDNHYIVGRFISYPYDNYRIVSAVALINGEVVDLLAQQMIMFSPNNIRITGIRTIQ